MARLHVTQALAEHVSPPRVWRAPMELTPDGFIRYDMEGFGGYRFSETGESENLAFDELKASRAGSRVVPSGLYMNELLKLDLTSPEQIVRFSSEFGALSGTDWSQLVPPEWLGVGDEYRRLTPAQIHRLAERTFPALRRVRRRTEPRATVEDLGFFHPNEFRVRAWLLGDITRIWFALRGVRSEKWALDSWKSTWSGTPTNLEDGLTNWVIPVLNVGLAPFHPRLVIVEGDDDSDLPDLYSSLCYWIASDIDQERDLAECHHCGRVYSRWHRAHSGKEKRRLDGAAFDIQRARVKGMIYCSRGCSSAASSKAERDRIRSLRGQGCGD